MNTIIIAGFSGIGKSEFLKKHRDVMDYDDPEFPKTEDGFIQYIKAMDGHVRYITMLTDIDLMQCLVDNGIEFHVVVPDMSRQDEFMKMYYRRDIENGLTERQARHNTYNIRLPHWRDEIEEILEFCRKNHKDVRTLEKGKYFSDAVRDIEMDMLLGDAGKCRLNERCHVAAYRYLGILNDITEWLKWNVEAD